LRELSKKGIVFAYDNTMPFSIHGQLTAGEYALEGDVSSQYVTGLLLALPLLAGDSVIRMLSPLESKPYVDLTISCMRRFGCEVEETADGYRIKGGQTFHACDAATEGDYSQAAFFCVANAIGNQVTMENLPSESAQGDQKIVEIANEMCYNKRTGKPACFDIDATDIPDLVPILAVLATFGDAPSRITGAHRLKIKESDRLAAISDLLCRLGGQVTANDDGLEIQPVASLHGGVVDSYGDHRIAMCAAIAATRCTQPVTILHGECVEKSYPQFYEDYNQLGGSAHVIVLE
jgi:3-phosphoshikimate 1-carboxyvinyltransferase